MTPERQSENVRTRRRALILLAVYALFVALPAAHLLLHDHDQNPALIGSAGDGTYLVAACGNACEHPFHEHEVHAVDEACAVCQALGSAVDLPQLAAPGRALLVPVALLVSIDHRLSKAPELGVPFARGPPGVGTPRFEMFVA